MPGVQGSSVTSTSQISTPVVKCENRAGHRALGSYELPRWVKHPDVRTPVTYLHPEDYMGSKRKHNFQCWNVAHIGAQCNAPGGQGFKMLAKATMEELNAPDSVEGWTPLHWAVLSDNPKAVMWLLKNGADRNAQDFMGRTAEDLVKDHRGEFFERYAAYLGPKRVHQNDPTKLMQSRVKQMQQAFNQVFIENEFDLDGYKAIVV
eukprot:TRINITY_DN1817_c0_g1_i1.p1 TRINITY_DN1817_c0_g1~~TRINITY_DN1817_c0_g1_i1.p1  ORF type:complete len:205 (+),score=30.17 TRINITY_DN1817_c0_g1_i1:78-692(+)